MKQEIYGREYVVIDKPRQRREFTPKSNFTHCSTLHALYCPYPKSHITYLISYILYPPFNTPLLHHSTKNVGRELELPPKIKFYSLLNAQRSMLPTSQISNLTSHNSLSPKNIQHQASNCYFFSTSLSTRKKFSPKIFLTSLSEYPRFSSSRVMLGR